MTEFLACNIHECLFLASSNLTGEQHQIQELARDFAKNELAPNMMTWDEEVRSFQDWLLRAWSFIVCNRAISWYWWSDIQKLNVWIQVKYQLDVLHIYLN